MDNIFKNLSNLVNINNINELSEVFQNPDSFTIRTMSLKKDSSFMNAFDSFKEDDEISELFDGLNYKANAEEIVDALNKSDNDNIQEVASFIENNLQSLKNIDLENKSVPAIIWSAVVYKFLSDDQSHVGITDFDNPYETVAKGVAQSMSEGLISCDKEDIQTIRNEVFEIFAKTDIASNVKKYFATAYIKNRIWSGKVSNWIDFSKFSPIQIPNNSYDIIDSQSLRLALSVSDVAAYQEAINFVSDKYFVDSTNDFNIPPEKLASFKAHLTVAIFASSVISDSQRPEFENIFLNLFAKIIAQREYIEAEIGKSNLVIGLTKLKEQTMLDIIEDVEYVAADIYRSLFGETINEESIDEEVTSIGEKKSKIKFGSKNEYVNGYFKLFGLLIEKKLSSCIMELKSVDDIRKRRAYSSEVEKKLEGIAKECNAIDKFVSQSEEKNNLNRMHLNAQTTFEEIQKCYASLSQIQAVFAKVKKKTGANLDITNVAFDFKFLRETSFITNAQHEAIIKEFYAFLASDPILKVEQPKYRLLSKNMKLMALKERSEENKTKYPFFAGVLKGVAISKKAQAEQIVDDLYVDEDGSLNENFEELYEIMTDSKANASVKQLAVLDAKDKGIISEEQADKLFNLLEPKTTKSAKISSDQLSFFESENDDEENENE